MSYQRKNYRANGSNNNQNKKHQSQSAQGGFEYKQSKVQNEIVNPFASEKFSPEKITPFQGFVIPPLDNSENTLSLVYGP